MSRTTRTVTELTDDIDGGEATESVTFALDGTSYEIDLNDENAQALRDALATYTAHARKTNRGGGRRGTPAPRRGSAGTANNLADVRAWAKEQGFAVSERGRISGEVLTAYESAH